MYFWQGHYKKSTRKHCGGNINAYNILGNLVICIKTLNFYFKVNISYFRLGKESLMS